MFYNTHTKMTLQILDSLLPSSLHCSRPTRCRNSKPSIFYTGGVECLRRRLLPRDNPEKFYAVLLYSFHYPHTKMTLQILDSLLPSSLHCSRPTRCRNSKPSIFYTGGVECLRRRLLPRDNPEKFYAVLLYSFHYRYKLGL